MQKQKKKKFLKNLFLETTEEETNHLKNLVTLGAYNYIPSFGKKLVDTVSLV